jgi:endonuclease/exonuclease/phosphatase family metal-dependent hydrolase
MAGVPKNSFACAEPRNWKTLGTGVRVVSYNCLAESLATDFEGVDAAALAWPARMKRIVVKIIDALLAFAGDTRAVEPFVVCLQEVDAACRDALLEQLRKKLHEQDWRVAIEHIYAQHAGAHGQLIVWDARIAHRCAKAKFFVHQDTTRASQRYVVVSFTHFTVAATHFKAGRAFGDERFFQMRQLLDAVERVDARTHGPLHAARPLIVAGDFNDGPGSRALNEAAQRGLARDWMDAANYAWTTWKKRAAASGAPDTGEKKAIEDGILVRNAVVLAAACPPSESGGRLPNAHEPSDHALLAAHIVF